MSLVNGVEMKVKQEGWILMFKAFFFSFHSDNAAHRFVDIFPFPSLTHSINSEFGYLLFAWVPSVPDRGLVCQTHLGSTFLSFFRRQIFSVWWLLEAFDHSQIRFYSRPPRYHFSLIFNTSRLVLNNFPFTRCIVQSRS